MRVLRVTRKPGGNQAETRRKRRGNHAEKTGVTQLLTKIYIIMKKLLFTFFGLILLGSTCLWGAAASGTITKTIAQIASRDGWQDGTRYKTFKLDDEGIISLTAEERSSGNQNGFYYSEGSDWRCYQARGEGKFSVDAKLGYVITSVNMIYGYKDDVKSTLVNTDVSPEATLNRKGEATMSIDDKQSVHFRISKETGSQARITQITIGYKAVLAYQVNSMTIGLSNAGYIHPIFNYGSETIQYSSNKENIVEVNETTGTITPKAEGTATITATGSSSVATYSITIKKELFVESFSKLESYKEVQNQQNLEGDNEWFKWVLKRFKHDGEDTIMGFQGIRLTNHSSNYIVYDAATIEGGVKHASFWWRALSSERAVNFQVDNTTGTIKKSVEFAGSVDNLNAHWFDEDININANARFRIKIMSEDASNIIFGPLTITPYLLFTNKTPSWDCKDGESFDLKDILIDNTGSPTYDVTAYTTGDDQKPEISATGVVNLSGVKNDGTISITASWDGVSTTTTLTVKALPKPTITFDNASVALNGSFKPLAVAKLGDEVLQDATITYESDNNNVAKVEGGNILLLKNGVAHITAKVAKKSQTYQAAEQTMTLTVTPFTPDDGKFHKETFSAIKTRTTWYNKDTTFVGIDGIYKWHAGRYERLENDYVGEDIATRITQHERSFIETDGVQEGGVQYILYNWRFPGAGNYNAKIQTYIINSDNDTISRRLVDTTEVAGGNYSFACAERFEVKENVKVRFKVTEATQTIAIGAVTIVPYLLFKQKTEDVNCKATLSYDLKDIPIINNTNADPIFTISSETGCTTADIVDGVLNLTNVIKTGDINITATWNNVTTTTKLVVTEAYSAVPTGVKFNVGATMNATVGNKFQIIGKVEPAEANPTITWSSNAEGVVFVDQNGMLDVRSAGTAIITATDVKGHATTCTITVAATTDEFFIENYQYLTPAENLQATAQPYTGTYKQGWRVRNYYYSSETELTTNVPGVELQGGSTNFIAYNNAQVEGGVKRVSFNWRAVDGTKPVIFDIDSTKSDANVNLVSLPANGGFDQVQSFSRDVNLDQNMQFRIHIVDATSSNVVFGPITVTPYLLYMEKTIELNKTACEKLTNYKYTNTAIINNTGSALENEAISYSISGDNNEKIAQLNTATGELSIIGKGKVTITATWGKVSTSYTLEVTDKLTPTISEFSDTEIDIFGSYAPAPKFKIGDVELTDAVYTFSSGTPAVASVKNNVFTIRRTGTSVITATLTGTDYYNTISPAPTCTLTVAEPKVSCWKDNYDALNDQTGGYNKYTQDFNGRGNVYKWQVANYMYQTSDLVNSERGIRIRHDKADNNFIAFDMDKMTDIGGIKAVFFNWRIPGNSTIVTDFTVSAGTYSKPVAISAEPGEYYSFAEYVGCKTNEMFKITVNTDGKATIFGPITIIPYLLYTTKTVNVPFSSEPYINKDFIDNTDHNTSSITYSLSGTDAANFNIDEQTGAVTMLKAGTVTVTATWSEGATTSYTLTTDGVNDNMETYETTATSYTYSDPAVTVDEKLSKWKFSLAGVKDNLNGFYGQNAAALRTPTDEEKTAGKTAYMESSKISGGLQKLAFLWNINGSEATTVWDVRIYVNGRLVKTLTNEDITATGKMAKPKSIVIDNINEPGNFVLRFENHSTITEDAITSNRARLTMDNIEYFPYDGALVLDEEQDNSLKISSHAGEELDVTLLRKLSAGKYNTFCVPFAIGKEDLATALGTEITKLVTLDESQPGALEEEGGQMNLNIAMTEAKTIEAGKPYLLEVADNVTDPIEISGVTIVNVGEDNYFQSKDEKVKFYGITSPYAIPNDNHYLFMSNNRLSWNNSGAAAYMKGLRSYFHAAVADPAKVSARLVFNQPSTPTEVENVNANVNANRKMIIDNQLIIIRDGAYYNANGQMLKMEK